MESSSDSYKAGQPPVLPKADVGSETMPDAAINEDTPRIDRRDFFYLLLGAGIATFARAGCDHISDEMQKRERAKNPLRLEWKAADNKW